MESLKLKEMSVAKSGRSYVFYIPPVYIRNGQLDLTKKYTVLVVEESEIDPHTKPALKVEATE